ncbi:anaerobic sulfatase maturase [Vibrio sp. 10N.286.52.B1]|uniref:anaerobic sulfatase maturase n=1 Tax=Vibrio sp. 10N.286.52.B1 TaxID=3229712 RepID=UPI00354EA2DF
MKSDTLGCHVTAKPTSSACNNDCHYCFYLDKEQLYQDKSRMNKETLETYIKQYIDANSGDSVHFLWQGGEPLLMGLDFFEQAIALSQQYSRGKQLTHSIQTNGILINHKWAKFFKANDILVGISIDGPEKQHNKYRLSRSGLGTHSRVVQGLQCLQRHHVRYNILTVVGEHNVDDPIEVYQHLLSLGAKQIQFIPLVERAQTNNLYKIELNSPAPEQIHTTSWSVDPIRFGQFLTAIFRQWIMNDVGRVFIQLFETTFAAWNGYPTGVCATSPTCGHNLVIEANGDVFQCDHYVYPEHKLGNVHTSTLDQINRSERVEQFGRNKYEKLSEQCGRCVYRFACHGGCPKHRFAINLDGEQHNYLCPAYEMFFQYAHPYLDSMKLLLDNGTPAETIMEILAQAQQKPRR